MSFFLETIRVIDVRTTHNKIPWKIMLGTCSVVTSVSLYTFVQKAFPTMLKGSTLLLSIRL